MKQQYFFRFLSVLFVGLIISAGAAWSDTRVVDYDEGPYTSIGAAVAAADPGDIISIEDDSAATYDEVVSVTKNLTVENNSSYDIVLTNTIGDKTDAFFDVTGGAALSLLRLNFQDTDGCAIRANGGSIDAQDCTFSGCDGNQGQFGGDVNLTVAVVGGGSANLSGCVIDNTLADLERNGILIGAQGPGAVLTAQDCVFRNHRNPDGAGYYGLKRAAVAVLQEATATLTRCQWECDGSACVWVALLGGVTLDRCLLQPLLSSATDTCDKLIQARGGFANEAYLAVNNSILDAANTQSSTGEACIAIEGESYVDVNYCTLLRGFDGIYANGDPYEFKIANSLVGRNDVRGVYWDWGGYDWEIWVEQCHFWGSPKAHYPHTSPTWQIVTHESGNTLDAAIFPGEPSDVDYVPFSLIIGNVLDLGTSTLLGLTADDYDEVGCRPRDVANDKGAQEIGAADTPTPTIPPPTGVRNWRVLR